MATGCTASARRREVCASPADKELRWPCRQEGDLIRVQVLTSLVTRTVPKRPEFDIAGGRNIGCPTRQSSTANRVRLRDNGSVTAF